VLVAGVDEAGRGPLAGPVLAAAVILNPDNPVSGIDDSKRLSAARREKLFPEIIEKSLSWCIAEASIEEIDQLNILHASMLAMKRAVEGLSRVPEKVLVDGNRLPHWNYEAEAVVGGDAIHAQISAASILAKVSRDRHMIKMDDIYPGYGFAVHKGYPTKQHLEYLKVKGPCKIHRFSYAPVRQAQLFAE
jgi:ribonuclease HII